MKPLKDMHDLPESTEMLIKRNVFNSDMNGKLEDKYTLHKKVVYSDKDFTGPVLEIVARHRIKDRNMAASKVVKGTSNFERLTFINKDGKKVMLSEAEVLLVNNIAAEFAITPNDVADFMGQTQGLTASMVDRVALAWRSDIGLYLRIGEGATKSEISNAIRDIDAVMQMAYGSGLPERTKPPENYALIYAIFRARKKGLSYGEIYSQYEASALPLYKGSKSIKTLEKFRQYYNQHKPDRPL